MDLRWIQPSSPLRSYVASIWVFESAAGLPADDSRLIVPRGCARITVPFRNALIAQSLSAPRALRETRVCQEGMPIYIGQWDRPAVIGSSARPTGTIGVELTPQGAYRFMEIDQNEATNAIVSFDDLFGAAGRRLQRAIEDVASIDGKVAVLEAFLVAKLTALGRAHPALDYAVSAIMASNGSVGMRELERRTGYSRRYLDLLFKRMIGLPPRSFAAITRFQRLYERWALTVDPDFYREALDEHYYDQAHFIRAFKRFTGLPPRSFARRGNEFGRIFYRA